MNPTELVNALRKEIVIKKEEDGQEKVLQSSKINKDALLVLSEQLNQSLFRGEIDFKKEKGKELLRKYVIFFFIPGFSSILNIPDDIFWNLMMIIYRILKNPEKVLSEEETSDLIFRLCNGRANLKPNGKVPFSDSARTGIIQHTKTLAKEGESSAAVFLKRLGSVAKEDLGSRINSMNFFIHEICSRGMEMIIDH